MANQGRVIQAFVAPGACSGGVSGGVLPLRMADHFRLVLSCKVDLVRDRLLWRRKHSSTATTRANRIT